MPRLNFGLYPTMQRNRTLPEIRDPCVTDVLARFLSPPPPFLMKDANPIPYPHPLKNENKTKQNDDRKKG